MAFPIVPVLAALPALGGGIFGAIGKRKAQKEAKKQAKARLGYALNAVGRSREELGESTELAKQNLIQSMASRGLSESSIREQALGALGRARARGFAALQDREKMARDAYNAFRKSRRMDALNDVVGLIGMGLSAGIGAAQYWDGGAVRAPGGAAPFSAPSGSAPY